MQTKKPIRVALIAMIFVVALPASSFAGGGLFSRIRANQTRQVQRTSVPVPQPASAPATADRGTSTSRLPAGRNYYQGRYYGNLNNRFYGPQYGYF